MKLTETLHGKGHAVYTDNFYSSPEPFEDLLVKKTLASSDSLTTVRRQVDKKAKDISCSHIFSDYKFMGGGRHGMAYS